MKVSEQWLREWVDPPLDVEAMGERLTMGGLEVDEITPAAPELAGIVAAEITAVDPHPQADRLTVCRVFDGASEHQVVCGAPNVMAGMRAPYAAPGVRLPDKRVIERARIRGVESAGMLCSAAELGLGDDASGILALPRSTSAGASLRELLQLDDAVLDIDLTPNRGDCFCVVGIARDLGALTDTPVTRPDVVPVPASTNARFAVELLDGSACPRYGGRVITEVDSGAATPLWMQERLRRMGVRCIHPLVDVTNYVMLELGQPMHAFDLDKLDRKIIVRGAATGERLLLLDGQDIALDAGTLVIADGTGPVALAGVMGGEPTAVSAETSNVFLESAFFDPVPLAGVARRYRLHTDASTRFERGVDPTMQTRAIERATALVLDICGGDAGPCEMTEIASAVPASGPVAFRPQAVERLLGTPVAEDRVEKILRSLDMAIVRNGVPWEVTPPAFRFDIRLEADLVEEVARVHGYDAIPLRLPKGAGRPAVAVQESTVEHAMRGGLIERGYFEAVTYSFIDPGLARRFDPEIEAVTLANPISSEMSVMRPSLWPGLVGATRYNLNRQHDDVRLFEIGMVFRTEPDGVAQTNRIGGLRCGPALPEQWGESLRDTDFYDFKQDVEAVLGALHVKAARIEASEDSALHPGQSAHIILDGGVIGRMGALHPALARHLDIDKPLYLFEINHDFAAVMGVPQYRPISKFPRVRRDINVVVDDVITAAACLEAAREAAGGILRDLQLFDVYRGQGIDYDKKSLTLGLIFQALSSTLVDDEVEDAVQRVVENLAKRVGGRLRN